MAEDRRRPPDWMHELTDHLVQAVAARLLPKFEAAIGKMEAAVFKIEGLRLDVNKVGTKVDTLTAKVDKLGQGGGLTPAQLKQLEDATTELRVAAATLKATVAFNN